MEFHFSANNNHNPKPSSSSSSSRINNMINHKKCKKKGTIGSAMKRSSSSSSGVTATRLSTDPQSVAARERRHRISNRFKILQSMVPGGTKMDTVSMLDEAIYYVKFLKSQIWLHQNLIFSNDNSSLVLDDTVLSQGQFSNWASGCDNADSALGMEPYSQPVPLPDSCFGVEETMHWYGPCVEYHD